MYSDVVGQLAKQAMYAGDAVVGVGAAVVVGAWLIGADVAGAWVTAVGGGNVGIGCRMGAPSSSGKKKGS